MQRATAQEQRVQRIKLAGCLDLGLLVIGLPGVAVIGPAQPLVVVVALATDAVIG